jgi:tetratricopeptide (TPR) repeat protein
LECEEALKYEPTSVRALYYLGISYSLQGSANEAKNAYLQVTRLAPGYHQVDRNLGVAYYHLGMADRTPDGRKHMFEQSIKYLKRAAELDISNTETLKIINLLELK